ASRESSRNCAKLFSLSFPNSCLGTNILETLFRNGVSWKRVPKRSLGTRRKDARLESSQSWASSSFRGPFFHYHPARLFARFAVAGDGDPAVLLVRIGHAHVPARGFDAWKLRQQPLEVLALELGAACEGQVFHVRRPSDVISLDGVFALDH